MEHKYTYSSDELELLPLTEAEIEPLRLLRNRDENRIWFYHSDIIQEKSQKSWFRNYSKKEHDYMMYVTLPNSQDAFYGAVALYDYDKEKNSYEVGRLLLDSKAMPKRGMGAKVVFGACYIGFRELQADSLAAEVFADNERSLRCFQKNHFSEEGRRT